MALYRIEPSPKTLAMFNALATALDETAALRDMDERNLTLDATISGAQAEALARQGHEVTPLANGFSTPTFDPTLV